MHQLYNRKQNSYWEKKVDDSRGNPRKLWKTLSNIMGKRRTSPTPASLDELTAEKFSKAFAKKVESVRTSTADAPRPDFRDKNCSSSFAHFQPMEIEFVRRSILEAPNKNCQLDPVPTSIVKQYSFDLAPFIANLCNASFRYGIFPATQKRALVTPVLKKSNLDASNTDNYRPISNLSFMSKLLERCANHQMNAYLKENDLLPVTQSAYRKYHSTETAVLKVLSDVYAAADTGDVTLLALLDLSAAFDTVDHQILLERLVNQYGFKDTVIDWFRSYLTDRSQTVYYNGEASTETSVSCGIPQGSVLGPALFILYSADAIAIAEKHGFCAHAYADDLQIYDHTDSTTALSLVPRLSACVIEINEWMASNRLRLNPTKTELIWLASARRLVHCSYDPLEIAGVWITPTSCVRDLGIMVDSDLQARTQRGVHG